MASATGRARCITCGKEKATLKCEGCTQNFCFDHVASHREELNKQLDDVEISRDLFRQTFIEKTIEPQKHPLLQQIDKWERDSMIKIRQAAEEARKMLHRHSIEHIKQIEIKLNMLTDQLRQSREDNDFFETDLCRWKEELMHLTEMLAKPANVNLRQDSTPLISKISFNILDNKYTNHRSSVPVYFSNNDINTRWSRNGITVAGGNGQGNELNQLHKPLGMYIDDDQTIYIADYGNHRIVEWNDSARNGRVVAGGNGQGNMSNQLNNPKDVILDKVKTSLIICDRGNKRVVQWPRQNGIIGQTIISDIDCYGLAMDNEGYIYISDCEKNEIKRWKMKDTHGIVIAGGNGRGNRLDQLHFPTNIFVDEKHSVYISDQKNHRVMKWMKDAKEGIVVAGGLEQGNSLKQLFNPHKVIIDQKGNIYVTDSANHRVMFWRKGASHGNIIFGGHRQGDHPHQLHWPTGMSFDRKGNLYVVDMGNHRIQKFCINSNLSS